MTTDDTNDTGSTVSYLPTPSRRASRFMRRLDVLIARFYAFTGMRLVPKPFLRVSLRFEHMDDAFDRMVRDGLYRVNPDGSHELVESRLQEIIANQRPLEDFRQG